jgi:hypothetical protein
MQRLVAFVMLIVKASPIAGQSLSALQPEGWERWATVPVSWFTVNPSAEDWVGAFLVDWPATYIQWRSITESPEWPAEQGTLLFQLLNGRHPYVFRYYRGDTALAESDPVYPLAGTPLQGRLSLVAGKPDNMRVSWTNQHPEAQRVVYGVSADALSSTAISIVSTYTAADFAACLGVSPIAPRTKPFANISEHVNRCGYGCYNDTTASELFLDPGFLHTAVLSLDLAAPRHFYNFGSDDESSPIYSFPTPPSPGSRTQPLSFLTTGDMGIGGVAPEEAGGATDNDPPANGADAVVAAIERDSANDSFLFLNGDISYARGWSVHVPCFTLM